MVNTIKVQNGIIRYIDTEIISKVDGWQKWALGAFASLKLQQMPLLIENIKKMFPDVIDKDNLIDIDMLHQEFAKQADKSAVTFEVPLIGALTLTRADVDKIYRCILDA